LKGDQTYKKRKLDSAKATGEIDDEEQFVLEDYDSDGENASSKNGSTPGGLSTATLELLEKLGMSRKIKEDDVEVEDQMKVRESCRQV